MSKVKSAVALVLITILLFGLCFMCTVSFSYGTDKMYTFNSVVSMLAKDAKLGGQLADGENYLGGGYTAVYYPEGVISAQQYEDDLNALRAAAENAVAADKEDAEKAVTDYEGKYVRYPDANGPIFLEKEEVCNEDGTVSDAFKEDFAGAVSVFRTRYEGLHLKDVQMRISDDYTVSVSVPAYTGAQGVILTQFSYTGEFNMGYGSDAASATKLSPGKDETVRDYVKGVRQVFNGSTYYVVIDLTDAGRDTLSEWTASASETAVTLYFYVGDNALISLSVSDTIDQNQLGISGSYTNETSSVVALALDTALNGAQTPLTFRVEDVVRTHAGFTDLALILIYISLGVLIAGMLAFFFVRYHGLGLAHLYTFLLWLFFMILIVWGVPQLHLGIETVLALVLGGTLLSVADVWTYEAVRKEFASGKTMASAVREGYKKSFWKLFDLHIALAILGVLLYAIAITELQIFGLTLCIGVLLSGLCSLFVSRFHWAAFMSFVSGEAKGRFCNFKQEVEDDE